MNISRPSLQIAIASGVLMIFLLPRLLSAQEKVRIIKKDASIHVQPRMDSAIITSLSIGAVLDCSGKVDRWFVVKLPPNSDGIIVSGYILQDFAEVFDTGAVVSKPEGQKEAPASPLASRPLAESHLKELAVRAKSHRKGNGMENILYGSLFGGLGLALSSIKVEDEDEADYKEARKLGTYLTAAGALFIGFAIIDLSGKSAVEKEYEAATLLAAEEREEACAVALADEARRGKIGRLVSGGIMAGLTVYLAAAQPIEYRGLWGVSENFNWNNCLAVMGGILALGSLLEPSLEERHYARYLEDKAQADRQSRVAFRLAIVPAGIAIGVSYTF